MSMKLMRKYSKPLMAFFGVLLMVTFLVGYTFTSGLGSRENGFILGSLNGESITTGSLTQVRIDLRILHYLRLRPLWLSNRNGSNGPLQFYLLLDEARRSGFQASPDQVRSDLKNKQLLSAVQALAESTQYAFPAVAKALEDMDTVNNMVNFVSGAALPSRPQVLHFMSRLFSSVKVVYVRLNAVDGVDHVPAPSKGLLTKLFAAYRNVLPWTAGSSVPPPLINGHHYPFGYRFPDRVKIEFIKLDRAQVRKGMRPTVADVQAAYHYYLRHRSDFTSGGGSATTKSAVPAVKPWSQVKAHLVEMQINRRIDVLFRHITDMILHLTAKPWKPGTTDYDQRLAPTKWVSYRLVAARMKREFGYQPEVGSCNHWLDARGLTALKGIGSAEYRQSGFAKQTLADLALKVHQLDRKPKGLALLLHLQVGREGPVLVDGHGNQYIYRVVAVRPAQDPSSLAQVKAKVIQDAKLLEAYRGAVTRCREMAVQAEFRSLKAIAKAAGLSLFEPKRFTELQETMDPSTGMPMLAPAQVSTMSHPLPSFTKAAFHLAVQLQSQQLEAAHGGATSKAPVHPAVALPVDSRMEAFTMQLIDSSPMPAAKIANVELLSLVMRNLAQSQAMRFELHWLSLKAVSSRVGFVPAKN